VTQQLASCAAAEAVDFALIRPASLAGAAWLLLWLPGGIWLGFVVGKAVADVFWYGAEAAARRGFVRLSGLAIRQIGAQCPDRAAPWAGDRPRSGEPLAGRV
jgi:hypothetical protein